MKKSPIQRRADHRSVEAARGEGEDGRVVCRQHGISAATFYQYGGMEVSEAQG
jgi:hypothetical protein